MRFVRSLRQHLLGIRAAGKGGGGVCNRQGRLLTVYLHRPTGVDRYEVLPERAGKRICIVEGEELSAVMVGEMSEQEMLRTAALAYTALNF